MEPVSASDYVPPDAEPSQRELDSLETVSPPRSRKALVAALAMMAGVVLIIGCMTVVFIQVFVLAESRARAKAEESFAKNRYGACRLPILRI